MRRHLTVICTSSFGDPKSDDMHRPMWSSAPSPEMSASFGRDYLVSLFAIQRPKSPVACRDNLWLSTPRHSKTPSLITRRDQCGHLHPPQRCQRLLVETLVSPSSSRDGKSDDTRRHLMVIRTLIIRRRQVR